MKPFSKSEALQGKPVVTRNGKHVWHTEEDAKRYFKQCNNEEPLGTVKVAWEE